ncbi:MAG: biotin/lipoyl-binding protein, partial [Alistipes sp.]|nr:biotin/lipoyl-binding protein [Alistipes sp.]
MRLSLVAFLLLAAGGCRPRPAEPEPVRPVKVVVAAGAGFLRKDFAGMATPDDAVTLAFRLSGQVADIPVSQGERVARGALLAELNPRDVELQVAATRSAFEEAQSQQQRMERLLAHEAV